MQLGARAGRAMCAYAAVATIGMGVAAAQAAVTLTVSDVSGEAATTVPVTVSVTYDFSTSDATQNVVATQNVLAFDHTKVSLAKPNKKPNCTVNADLFNTKGATAFSFLPDGCDPTAGTCASVNAAVFATDNNDPILPSDGPPASSGPVSAVMYTCTVAILPGATGTTPLGLSNTIASGYDVAATKAVEVCGTNPCTLVNGTITITVGGPTVTPTIEGPAALTPTPTATDIPTDTPTPGVTPTRTRTHTPTEVIKPPVTRTPTPVATQPSGGGGGTQVFAASDKGCRVGTGDGGRLGWSFVVPVAVLGALRRRRRQS